MIERLDQVFANAEPRELGDSEVRGVAKALEYIEHLCLVEPSYEDTLGDLNVEVVDISDDPDLVFLAEANRHAYNILKRHPDDISDEEILQILESSGINEHRKLRGYQSVTKETQNILSTYLQNNRENNTQSIGSNRESVLLHEICESMKQSVLLYQGAVSVATRIRYIKPKHRGTFSIRINVYWYDGDIAILHKPEDAEQRMVWLTEYEITLDKSMQKQLAQLLYRSHISTRDPRTRNSAAFQGKRGYPTVAQNSEHFSKNSQKSSLDRDIVMWAGAILLKRGGDEAIKEASKWFEDGANLSDLHP